MLASLSLENLEINLLRKTSQTLNQRNIQSNSMVFQSIKITDIISKIWNRSIIKLTLNQKKKISANEEISL